MSGLISLREAAIISGYHQDYLSFLIRKNKIHGEKIGRAWCVKEDELRMFLLKKNTTENDSNKKSEKTKENLHFFDTKMKQISFFLFFVILSSIIFFQLDNDKKVKKAIDRKDEFVINTVYSETTSEVSSETSTKN